MDMKGKPRSRGVLQEEEKDGAEVRGEVGMHPWGIQACPTVCIFFGERGIIQISNFGKSNG